MVSPSLTRRHLLSGAAALGGMLASPAIVRAQTCDLVVGGAADMAGLAH